MKDTKCPTLWLTNFPWGQGSKQNFGQIGSAFYQ